MATSTSPAAGWRRMRSATRPPAAGSRRNATIMSLASSRSHGSMSSASTPGLGTRRYPPRLEAWPTSWIPMLRAALPWDADRADGREVTIPSEARRADIAGRALSYRFGGPTVPPAGQPNRAAAASSNTAVWRSTSAWVVAGDIRAMFVEGREQHPPVERPQVEELLELEIGMGGL